MTAYNKLVRDKIPDILDEKGIEYDSRIADEEEYHSELVKKLLEEAHEFAASRSPEELADVIEITRALQQLQRYGLVEFLRLKKKEEKGGFEKRIILKGDSDDKPLV